MDVNLQEFKPFFCESEEMNRCKFDSIYKREVFQGIKATVTSETYINVQGGCTQMPMESKRRISTQRVSIKKQLFEMVTDTEV